MHLLVDCGLGIRELDPHLEILERLGAKRGSARAAFVSATRYPKSSKQARDWVGYIDAINRTEEDQNKLEAAQLEEQRVADIARLKQQTQVCRLQGGDDCPQLEAQLKAITEAGPVPLRSSCKGANAATEQPAAQPAEQPANQ